MIQNAEISGESKAILYYGKIAEGQDKALMQALADSGADSGTVANTLMDINNADNNLKGAERSNKIRDIIANAALTEEEKIEIYRAKVSDTRDDDIQAFAGVGLDFDMFLKAHSEYTRIGEEYSGAGRKATEFSRWVNSLDVRDSQASVIKDCFKYYSQIPASASRYEGFVAAGLGDELAYSLTMDIDALKPMAGEDQVKSIQRWRAVVDGANGEADQLAALSIVMTPEQYDKLKIANDYQVSPASYVSLQEVLPEYDSNGNGNYANAEAKAAIDGICATGRVTLNNAQKAALWQLATGTSSAKNNPYSSSVGWQVLDAKKAVSSENDEDELAGTFEEEILRQWGNQ